MSELMLMAKEISGLVTCDTTIVALLMAAAIFMFFWAIKFFYNKDYCSASLLVFGFFVIAATVFGFSSEILDNPYKKALSSEEGYSISYVDGVIDVKTSYDEELSQLKNDFDYYIVTMENGQKVIARNSRSSIFALETGKPCVLLVAKDPMGNIFFAAIEENTNLSKSSDCCEDIGAFCTYCGQKIERHEEQKQRYCGYCGRLLCEG